MGERGGGRVEGAGELGFERREPGVEGGVDVGETVGVAEGGFLAEGAALEAFAVGGVEGCAYGEPVLVQLGEYVFAGMEPGDGAPFRVAEKGAFAELNALDHLRRGWLTGHGWGNGK